MMPAIDVRPELVTEVPSPLPMFPLWNALGAELFPWTVLLLEADGTEPPPILLDDPIDPDDLDEVLETRITCC